MCVCVCVHVYIYIYIYIYIIRLFAIFQLFKRKLMVYNLVETFVLIFLKSN